MNENTRKRYSVSEEYCTKGISATLRETANYELHWHSFYELEIVVSGTATHSLNSDEYEIKRGCAYILSPIDFHKITDAKNLKLWHIVIDETALSPSRILELSTTTEKNSHFRAKLLRTLPCLQSSYQTSAIEAI